MDKNFFYADLGTDTEPEKLTPYRIESTDTCPICGEQFHRNGKCCTCFECGWSSCEL